jgi:predicted component of type VI protein secretion system
MIINDPDIIRRWASKYDFMTLLQLTGLHRDSLKSRLKIMKIKILYYSKPINHDRYTINYIFRLLQRYTAYEISEMLGIHISDIRRYNQMRRIKKMGNDGRLQRKTTERITIPS